MNVLIFTHTFAPNVGGVETYLHLLAEGLVALPPGPGSGPTRVTVATRTPRGAHDDEALPYTVVRDPDLRTWSSLCARAEVVHLGGPALAPLAVALAQRARSKRGPVVVVEHHAYQSICPNGLLLREPEKAACDGAFMAGRLHECVRCVAAVSGPARGLAQVASMGPRRLLLHGVDANVGVSAHVARRIALGPPRFIHHGIVDPLGGRPPDAVPPPPVDPTRGPVFAYIGRLVSEKGLPLLVRAAERLHAEGRTFRVRFIGDGPERAALAALARSLGVEARVEWTGFVRGAEFEAAVADVAAVVMPSVWEETAGLAAIEQMMRGRVVVASATGGLAEIVGDAGLTFPVGDEAALAAALRRLVEDSGLVAALGRAARARALVSFSQRRMAEEHRALYRSLLASRRGDES